MQVTFESFDVFLVALSYAVSVFGSFTALQLAIRIPSADKQSIWLWLISASVAIGGGAIWSMHFIGMLAFKTPFAINYDLTITLISLVIPIIVCMLGLRIVGRGESGIVKLISGGLIIGLGVSAMHYSGMAAMRMPATIHYDTGIVALSVVIGIVAATAALWLAFNLRGILQRFGSAFIMGIAVCGMHYTGMMAVSITVEKAARVTESLFSTTVLGISIFSFAVLLLCILLMISFMNPRPRTVTA